jgi:hypothetical protein
MSLIQKGTYQHFKGNKYEVIDIALHSETQEEMIVYRSLKDPSKLWVRPAKMFLEFVDKPEYNYKGPRFQFIEKKQTHNLIKKEESKKKSNSDNCFVWEYEYDNHNLSIATALINDRYPETGKGANTKCQQIYYVINGSGEIHSDKGVYNIKEGDVYFFEKEEKYFVIGKNLHIVIINSPKWTSEQYIHIEE